MAGATPARGVGAVDSPSPRGRQLDQAQGQQREALEDLGPNSKVPQEPALLQVASSLQPPIDLVQRGPRRRPKRMHEPDLAHEALDGSPVRADLAEELQPRGHDGECLDEGQAEGQEPAVEHGTLDLRLRSVDHGLARMSLHTDVRPDIRHRRGPGVFGEIRAAGLPDNPDIVQDAAPKRQARRRALSHDHPLIARKARRSGRRVRDRLRDRRTPTEAHGPGCIGRIDLLAGEGQRWHRKPSLPGGSRGQSVEVRPGVLLVDPHLGARGQSDHAQRWHVGEGNGRHRSR